MCSSFINWAVTLILWASCHLQFEIFLFCKLFSCSFLLTWFDLSFNSVNSICDKSRFLGSMCQEEMCQENINRHVWRTYSVQGTHTRLWRPRWKAKLIAQWPEDFHNRNCWNIFILGKNIPKGEDSSSQYFKCFCERGIGFLWGSQGHSWNW